MQRRRRLTPDTTIWTEAYGEIPVVSDQAFLETLMAFGQLQTIAGGVVTQIVDRHPTDVPGEMVTTQAVFEWKDRTDAKSQPETQTGVAYVQQPESADPTPEELEAQLEDELLATPAANGEDELPEPDEAEDDSAIPAGQR
jgi:hypothetical protein